MRAACMLVGLLIMAFFAGPAPSGADDVKDKKLVKVKEVKVKIDGKDVRVVVQATEGSRKPISQNGLLIFDLKKGERILIEAEEKILFRRGLFNQKMAREPEEKMTDLNTDITNVPVGWVAYVPGQLGVYFRSQK